MLCDSKTTYTLKFNIFRIGKTISETVLSLLKNYFGKNHIIYMDNYYNSIKLTELLFEKQVYTCGTLRANGKTLKKLEIKFNLLKKKDQICCEVSENYIIGDYYDKKQIRFITSFYKSKNILSEKLVKTTKIDKK
ncbi:hypothetical protein CDIK_3337 [Cucumispora dikerogammari]|nr:hypothetical protein CDIK_3337 [Cucumispora dikerogammari]